MNGICMFAVIKTGGKQYTVRPGQTLRVEKLGTEKGPVAFTEVLLVSDEGSVKVGTPHVAGAKVEATILGEEKGKKLIIQKYKPKVRYRRKTGHRQTYAKVKIEKIVA